MRETLFFLFVAMISSKAINTFNARTLYIKIYTCYTILLLCTREARRIMSVQDFQIEPTARFTEISSFDTLLLEIITLKLSALSFRSMSTCVGIYYNMSSVRCNNRRWWRVGIGGSPTRLSMFECIIQIKNHDIF